MNRDMIPELEGLLLIQLAKKVYEPKDLWWSYQIYKNICRQGRNPTLDFYERSERMEFVRRARRQMAECLFISKLYPQASWDHPGLVTDIVKVA